MKWMVLKLFLFLGALGLPYSLSGMKRDRSEIEHQIANYHLEKVCTQDGLSFRLIAYDKNKEIGSITCSENLDYYDTWDIDLLTINTDYRNKKVGSLLFKEAFAQMHLDHDVKHIHWEAFPPNPKEVTQQDLEKIYPKLITKVQEIFPGTYKHYEDDFFVLHFVYHFKK